MSGSEERTRARKGVIRPAAHEKGGDVSTPVRMRRPAITVAARFARTSDRQSSMP